MDTITHGIIGALAGKALLAGRDVPAAGQGNDGARAISAPAARVAIAACTLGSMFPDIDIFAGPLAHNPLAIMEWHRAITHSAVLLPVWALVLAAISVPLVRWVRWKSPPFWKLYAAYALGIATHIFLDLVTSFGTIVWSPLRDSRPAWDWIFIIDLTFTALALAPQLAAWCYREPRVFWPRAVAAWVVLAIGSFGTYLFASSQGYGFPIFIAVFASAVFAVIIFLPAARGAGFRWTRASWCRAGLALACVYIGVAARTHHKALADVERFAAEQHLHADQLAALPLPPTLTHWVGLISTPEGVWRETFHEPVGTVENTQFYATAGPSPLIDQAKTLHGVQVYLWFARYPVWRMRQTAEQQTVLDISDVRFIRERGRARRGGFAFEVVFDPGGRVLSSGFQEEP